MSAWITTHVSDFGILLQGVGSILTAVAVFFGFVFTRRQLKANEIATTEQRKIQSLNVMTDLFRQFYQIDKLDDRIRRDFEYEFFDRFAPAMEKSPVYLEELTSNEKDTLVQIDALLNFFEHIAYLSERSEFLTEADRKAAFSYWFDDVMRRSSHAILRRYALLGFESLVAKLELRTEPVRIAVYGTLMEGEQNDLAQSTKRKLKRVGSCIIPGRLYDVGKKHRYPGLLLSKTPPGVTGELMEIGANDADAIPLLREMDKYEGFDPNAPEESEYVRRFIVLDKPKVGAWVYVLNKDPAEQGLTRISSSNWKLYRESGYAS